MPRKAFVDRVYHIVWRTHKRLPMLYGYLRPIVYREIYEVARKHKVMILAMSAVRDHLHMVLRVYDDVLLNKVIGQMKGKASFTVNKLKSPLPPFKWNRGYYMRSVGPKELKSVIGYVQNQSEHHNEGPEDEFPDIQIIED